MMIKLFEAIKNVKWIWVLLKNWELIDKIIVDGEMILNAMSKRHSALPDCNELKLLIDDIKLCVDADIIQMSDYTKQTVDQVLNKFHSELVCKIESKPFEIKG